MTQGRSSLANSTRSELTQQFTTSMWWILGLVLFVYVAVTAGGSELLTDGLPPLDHSTIGRTLKKGGFVLI